MFLRKLRTASLAAAVMASAAVAAGLAAAPPSAPSAVPSVRTTTPPKAAPARKAVPAGPDRLVVWWKGDLVSVAPDGSDKKTVAAGLPGIGTHDFAVSPEGRRVALNKSKRPKDPPSPQHLIVLELGKESPEVGLAEVEEGLVLGVAWSADGTELAFSSGKPNLHDEGATYRYAHWRVNLVTKARAVVPLPAGHLLMDWSRDGRFFLTESFVGHTDSGHPVRATWVLNADGTVHKRLPSEYFRDAPFGRLSPDGNRVLAIVTRFPAGAVRGKDQPDRVPAVVDVATGREATIPGIPVNAVEGLCWSPDGRRVACVWSEQHEPGTQADRDTSHLIVCDPDGANRRTVLTARGRGAGYSVLGSVDWR